MHKTSLLTLCLIVVSSSIAGCLGPEDASDTARSGDELDDAQKDEGDTQDGLPVPLLHAVAAGTPGNLTGPVPLEVTFNLSVEHEDPRELNWTFDPGDGSGAHEGNTSGLPRSITHTYEERGVHVANLTAWIGNDSSHATATVVALSAVDSVDWVTVVLLVHTDVAGHAGDAAKDDRLPGSALCAVQTPPDVDAGAVLDEAVETACISQWSFEGSQGERFVTSVDGLEARGAVCITYPVACQWWEFRINGEPATVGIDAYTAEHDDLVELYFHTA